MALYGGTLCPFANTSNTMRDAYDKFFDVFKVSPEAFFKFGLDEIITVPVPKATAEWNSLKHRMETGAPVTIRSFGQKGSNTQLFLALYAEVFEHPSIVVDPTNNAAPSHVLQSLTGYSKTKRKGCELLCNYQVSHVFGRTKNPYAFTAPWNIVYIPKIVDPFTGHEAPGTHSAQFQVRFRRHVYELFTPLIQDFNDIVTDSRTTTRINKYLEQFSGNSDPHPGFVAAVRKEFTPISAETEI